MSKNDSSQKRAMQFDFMSMFSEARKTAMERSQPVLATREEQCVEDGRLDMLNRMKDTEESNSDTDLNRKDASTNSSVVSSLGHVQIGERSMPTSNKLSRETNEHVDAAESDSEDDCGPPIPDHLKMKRQTQECELASDDDECIGPLLPPGSSKTTANSENSHATLHADVNESESEKDDPQASEEEDYDEDEDNPLRRFPQDSSVSLDHGSKPVSAVSLDPAGARLVTGGYEYNVKFWDFAGMDSSLRSFRSITPCESHAIHDLKFSPTGNMILVISGNAQAKVIDRDAHAVMECAKGDQYIVDMASTKGHTAMLNAGCWHPKVKEEFMTCSNDGTLRLWDINNPKKHKSVIKPKTTQGRRAIPTTCTYSHDGRWVAGACQDGSIQIWDHNKMFVNVAMKSMNAHMSGPGISSLCYSYDNTILASRGGDDTLKLWDTRKFQKPLCIVEDLCNLFPMTDCLFSPDDKLVVTGTSVKKGEGCGKLVVFDRHTLERVAELEVAQETSVIRCVWHTRLNEIVCGCGDGSVKIYFDDSSQRGVKLSLQKKTGKKKQIEMMIGQNVITPYALKMFRQSRPTSSRKYEEKLRNDPLKSHRPDLPISGPGVGGRVGNHGATLSQYVIRNIVLRKPDERDKDPRSAILRHAEAAAANPFWVTPAYEKTQPKTVFQPEGESDHEKDDDIAPAWKKKKL